jgi:WD40 repeat protein
MHFYSSHQDIHNSNSSQPSPRMTEEVAHPITRTSTPVRTFNNLDDVAGVVVFPDRRRMATSSKDGFLRVWNLKDGVMLKEMDARGQEMRDIALSRDGQWIASCDCGGYVIAWHGDTLTEAFRAHSNATSLEFSPDGAMMEHKNMATRRGATR